MNALEHSAPRPNPRAMITVAILIALVLLQLVVVGAVIGGSRDHDLTARRAETVRAFYAAEAGMNMSIRELMSGADEDGDGGIGTISADASDSSDPSLGAARFTVTSASAGAQTTFSSRGRCGSAARLVEAVIE